MRHSNGFTLTEVALSMALVAVAILSLFLVIPQGFKAQRAVRYQVLAAAKAMELVDLLHANAPGVMHNGRDLDKEGVYPWDGRATYSSMAPDLESALESLLSVVKPLPEGIARRLDSENNEIGKLLDAGGRIYYFYPSDPAGAMMVDPDLAQDRNWFDATNTLLVGVVGSAQQNSILYYPSLKVGPYQAFYPSPPTHGSQKPRWGIDDVGAAHTTGKDATPLFCYDVTRDRQIGKVWMDEAEFTWLKEPGEGPIEVLDTDHFGAAGFLYHTPQGRGGVAAPDTGPDKYDDRRIRRAKAVAYLIPALWYAREQGFDPLTEDAFLTPFNLGNDTEGAYDPSTDLDAFVETYSAPDKWQAVLAMRYVAHAGMCLAACYTETSQLNSATGIPLGGGTGDNSYPEPFVTVVVDPADPDPSNRYPTEALTYEDINWTDLTVNLDRIRAWHEASVRLAVLHADQAGPYHWGAPRPLNRQVMMDHPLVQLDLWMPPVKDDFPWVGRNVNSYYTSPAGRTITTNDTFPPHVINGMEPRRQWKALFGSKTGIQQPGRPFMYPGRVLDTSGDGKLDDADEPIPDWIDDYSDDGVQGALGIFSHFNLTYAFDPAERARELVFWSAEWQSYEDFESHPSAEIDASRYPIVAPMPWKDNPPRPYSDIADGFFPSDGADPTTGKPYERLQKTFSSMPANHPWNRRSSHMRQLHVYGSASVMALSSRNPEHITVFELPSRKWDETAGAFRGPFIEAERPVISEINDFGGVNESKWQGANAGPQQSVDITNYDNAADDTPAIAELFQHPDGYQWWNKFLNLGIYGANRNGQLTRRRVQLMSLYGSDVGSPGWNPKKDLAVVDRGTIPATVRLHAATVARFIFYDPRISGGHFQ